LLASLAAIFLVAAGPRTVAAQDADPTHWQGFQANVGHSGSVDSVAPAAFQPLWVARPEPPPLQARATAVVYNGKAVISDLSPPSIAGCKAPDEYAILAYDPTDGRQLWRRPTRGKLAGSPQIDGGLVFAVVWDCPVSGNHADSSHLLAIDTRSGDLVWQRTLEGAEAGPPVAAGGLVVVPGRALRSLLAFDAGSGEPRWQAPMLDEARFALGAPAVSGDTVFAVDSAHLYAFDLASGALRWRLDADGKGNAWHEFYDSPVAADGLVMVVGRSMPPPPAATSRISFEAYDAGTGAFRSGLTLSERAWANVHWGSSYRDDRAFISGAWLDAAGTFQRGLIAFDVLAGGQAWRLALDAEVFPPAIDSAGRLLATGTLHDAWLLDSQTGATLWASDATHSARPWRNEDSNGNPLPGLPTRDEWLPDRWSAGVDGSPLLLDSIEDLGAFRPVLAGGLAFAKTGMAEPYLAAYAADTTPPSAEIRRPVGGFVTLGRESVYGTAYDYNLRSWKLEYGSGTDPQAWTLLKEDTKPRQGHAAMLDALGTWDGRELGSGVWTLRLTVTDTAGLTSTATTQFKNDLAPPSVEIEWPRDGMTLESADIRVTGTASDDFELKQVTLAAPQGGPRKVAEGLEQWSFAFSASGRDAGDWIVIEAMAEDMNGNVARDEVRVRLAPLSVKVSDEGRRLTSNYPIFVAPTLGRDHDGLLDAWEDAAIALTEAIVELDEEEDWLLNRDGEPVAQFARVRPFVPAPSVQRDGQAFYGELPIAADADLLADPPPYVVFQFVLRWAKDYGRFGIEGHDIDTEKYFMAWKVIDERTLELAYVFTSSHRSPNAHHSVWDAWGTLCNVTDVANVWNEDEWDFEEYDHSEVICGALVFTPEGRLVLYPSEDKHAIYPSEPTCESVTLTENVGPNAGEDCGWQPSSSPVSNSRWTDTDFADDPRYRMGGRWLLDVVNTGDEPYILAQDGQLRGLPVPLDTLGNDDDNPPQILRRAMVARYRIEVHTADRSAEPDFQRIDLSLRGTQGLAPLIALYTTAQPPRDAIYAGHFEAGASDVFYAFEQDLGDLEELSLALYSRERDRVWAPDWIRVTALDSGQDWYFAGTGWLPGSPGGTVNSLYPGDAPAGSDYRVAVTTGDRRNAGTDANVTLTLFGGSGATSGPLLLDKPDWNDFERNSLDVFTLRAPVDVGELDSIELTQDGSGEQPGWFLRDLKVTHLPTGRAWVFFADRWLADDEPGGRTALLLPTADCGQADYRVKVFTSGIEKAGTDAEVFLSLGDTEGLCRTGEINLDSAADNFEAGHADTFLVRAPNVASLGRLQLRHDGFGENPGWHVSSIVVENLTAGWRTVFNPGAWLEGDQPCWASDGACQ